MNTALMVQGKEFNRAAPEEVADFLRSRSLVHLELQPDCLHVSNDGRSLQLQVSNGVLHEYPMRKSFLFKLLKWFSFPLTQLHRLNLDTLTSILNDFLLAIRSGNVTVAIEEGDALTITSNKFARMADLDVFGMCKSLGVENISRNDFFLRIYSEVKYRREIVKGDDCGFGYNVLNSETGFRALSVQHYLLRYVCTNGAVAPIRTGDGQRVHYGYAAEELKGWLGQQIGKAELECSGLLTSLRKTLSERIDGKDEGLSRKVTGVLGRGEGSTIMGKVSEESSLFDVFNLLTHEAKRLDVGRRLQMEMIAGDLLPQVEH